MAVNLNKLGFVYSVHIDLFVVKNTGAFWLVFCRLCMNYQLSDNSFNK
jgi:hypothetical protein